jgi:hypothetical protein
MGSVLALRSLAQIKLSKKAGNSSLDLAGDWPIPNPSTYFSWRSHDSRLVSNFRTKAMPPPPATPALANTRRNIIFAFWVRKQSCLRGTDLNRRSFSLDSHCGGRPQISTERNCHWSSWMNGPMERYLRSVLRSNS